jgi:hypothetical protein
MQILPGKEQEYATWKANNATDPYGARIFSYAEDWAESLEQAMQDRPSLTPAEVIALCADPLAQQADTDGITGFMYGGAVSVLRQEWVHGERLYAWVLATGQV